MLHTKDHTSKLLDMEHVRIEEVEVDEKKVVLHVSMERRFMARSGATPHTASSNAS